MEFKSGKVYYSPSLDLIFIYITPMGINKDTSTSYHAADFNRQIPIGDMVNIDDAIKLGAF